MTTLINGRTPEQYAAWNRWHTIVAIVLALLLLLLWLMGKGPGAATASGSCCGVATPEVAAPVAAPAAVADSDGDGVLDPEDACPGTAAGVIVDATGCEVAAAAPVAEVPAASPIPAVNVYFDLDKTDLPATASADLVPIIEYLKANPSAVANVSGYHDPQGGGDSAHNLELAKNRAKAVRDLIVAAGVPEAQTDLVKPGETTGTGDNPEARRVEVSIRP